jgi:hypothetical protein
MLTQEQKVKLDPLTKHERYGKLLQEAIKGWEEVNPKKDVFGVYWDDGEFKLDTGGLDSVEGCCLLGSAMMHKKSDDDYVLNSVRYSFALNEEEASKLMSGFDGDGALYSNEAYEFGLKINKILFP